MRSVLVDWMTRMIHRHRMRQETLFLAVNVMDRFLSLTPVSADCLQLLGIVALFIAGKQVRAHCRCVRAYDKEMFVSDLRVHACVRSFKQIFGGCFRKKATHSSCLRSCG